jgi:hypothetical protein
MAVKINTGGGKSYGGGKNPSQRPSKICPVCQRPFAWRKAWRNNWENVVYCSDRCRSNAKKPTAKATERKPERPSAAGIGASAKKLIK